MEVSSLLIDVDVCQVFAELHVSGFFFFSPFNHSGTPNEVSHCRHNIYFRCDCVSALITLCKVTVYLLRKDVDLDFCLHSFGFTCTRMS